LISKPPPSVCLFSLPVVVVVVLVDDGCFVVDAVLEVVPPLPPPQPANASAEIVTIAIASLRCISAHPSETRSA